MKHTTTAKTIWLRLLAAALLLLVPMTLAACGGKDKDGASSSAEAVSSEASSKDPADDTLHVLISEVEGKPGEKVTVKVSLENNPGIQGFSFCLSYDEKVFTAAEGKVTMEDNAISFATPADEGMSFAWTSLTPFEGNGEICEMELTIAEDAKPGDYPIKLYLRKNYDSFYQIIGEEMPDFPLTKVNGNVKIAG